MDSNISIFISYSWKDKGLVNKLDSRLRKYGYKVERDIRDAEHAHNIKEFMKRIRKTDYSIIVLSDGFLKSENCMREIIEFIKDDNYKDRIIPVIVESAKEIWGDYKGISYTAFWQEKEKSFKQQLERIDEESKSGYIEELKHISTIKDSMGEIIKIFRDMKMFDASDRGVARNIIDYISVTNTKDFSAPVDEKRIIYTKPNAIFIVILSAIVIGSGMFALYYQRLVNSEKIIGSLANQLMDNKEQITKLSSEIINNGNNETDEDIVDSGNRAQGIIMSETGYKNAITEEARMEVVYSHYNDFDADGIREMFAIVGEQMDDILFGEIWFVNQQGAYKVEDSKYYRTAEEYLFDDKIIIAFEEYYTTGTITYLWSVKDGKPFQPSLTTKAHGLEVNQYNEIIVTGEDYDGAKTIFDDWKVLPDDEMWTGHTWKPYYYYWNGDDFREYGAIAISSDELLQIEGAEELIDYIKNLNGTINEIYYRANDVIQINYQIEERESNATTTYYHYIMFRYDGKKVELENCEMREGNVLKALNTSLAVYPDGFVIDR